MHYWDTSAAGQTLRRGIGLRPIPVASGPSLIGFAWSGNFKLQARTNSISANWADYPGGTNSPFTVPLDLLQQTVFFRLLWPP